MSGRSKTLRLVKKAVQSFCDKNGYILKQCDDGKGRKGANHGVIIVDTGKHTVQVGYSGTSKGGTETTCRMVVQHLKNKISRLEAGLDPRSGN